MVGCAQRMHMSIDNERERHLVSNDTGVCIMHLFRTLSFSASLVVSACTGSPATLALPPEFDVATSAGPASVSIRETPPEMTFTEFKQAVSVGMQSAMPICAQTTTVAPFPTRRIVWHVYPIFPRGASRLVVNVFHGSVPFEHAQQVIDDSAPPSTIVYAVRTLTGRLAAQFDKHDVQAVG